MFEGNVLVKKYRGGRQEDYLEKGCALLWDFFYFGFLRILIQGFYQVLILTFYNIFLFLYLTFHVNCLDYVNCVKLPEPF